VTDDSELTSAQPRSEITPPRSELTEDADFDVVVPQPSTAAATDDATLDIRGHLRSPGDDRPSPPHEAESRKSRGKRRVKNKGRAPTAEVRTDAAVRIDQQQLNGGGQEDLCSVSDWFVAVRAADVATVRRLAQSTAVDVNATDGVSRDDKQPIVFIPIPGRRSLGPVKNRGVDKVVDQNFPLFFYFPPIFTGQSTSLTKLSPSFLFPTIFH